MAFNFESNRRFIYRSNNKLAATKISVELKVQWKPSGQPAPRVKHILYTKHLEIVRRWIFGGRRSRGENTFPTGLIKWLRFTEWLWVFTIWHLSSNEKILTQLNFSFFFRATIALIKKYKQQLRNYCTMGTSVMRIICAYGKRNSLVKLFNKNYLSILSWECQLHTRIIG